MDLGAEGAGQDDDPFLSLIPAPLGGVDGFIFLDGSFPPVECFPTEQGFPTDEELDEFYGDDDVIFIRSIPRIPPRGKKSNATRARGDAVPEADAVPRRSRHSDSSCRRKRARHKPQSGWQKKLEGHSLLVKSFLVCLGESDVEYRWCSRTRTWRSVGGQQGGEEGNSASLIYSANLLQIQGKLGWVFDVNLSWVEESQRFEGIHPVDFEMVQFERLEINEIISGQTKKGR